MIDALTQPLTREETIPKPKEKEVFLPVEITAESYEAALEKFNQLFLENHWGDGLPLLPPTPERVKWMLTGTNRSPNEVIGKVAPKNGIATIEKIAINAVMAGAKPEYLPVISSWLTPERVKQHFAHNHPTRVERFDLPGFGAMNFLLHDVLGGGGMASLRTDNLAKAYGQVLLALEVAVPPGVAV